MFKAKAKARIYLGDKVYQPGSPIEVTKEQYETLKLYLEDVQELKEEVKPKRASTRKAKKEE